MSHNSFDSRELIKISEGLDKNHTILGIHLTGNEGDTDAMGFIECHDDDGLIVKEDISRHMLFTRIEPILRTGVRTN